MRTLKINSHVERHSNWTYLSRLPPLGFLRMSEGAGGGAGGCYCYPPCRSSYCWRCGVDWEGLMVSEFMVELSLSSISCWCCGSTSATSAPMAHKIQHTEERHLVSFGRVSGWRLGGGHCSHRLRWCGAMSARVGAGVGSYAPSCCQQGSHVGEPCRMVR